MFAGYLDERINGSLVQRQFHVSVLAWLLQFLADNFHFSVTQLRSIPYILKDVADSGNSSVA